MLGLRRSCCLDVTTSEQIANKTASTCSNPDSCDEAAPERWKAERLLIVTIKQILHASRQFELFQDSEAASQINYLIARIVEQSSERAVRRVDIECPASRAGRGKDCEQGLREQDFQTALMTRPA